MNEQHGDLVPVDRARGRASPNTEAARYIRRLRETEAERDACGSAWGPLIAKPSAEPEPPGSRMCVGTSSVS